MPLVVCDQVFGGAHIDRSPLRVHRIENAVLIPLGHPHKPGVYTATGELFRPAAYFRGLPEPHLVLEAERTDLDIEAVPFAPESCRYVFGGHLTGHFGHFLFSMLARLWSLPKPLPQDLKIVLLNPGSIDDVFETEFIGALFSALGIERSSFAVFHQPVRFRTLDVPSPSMEENHQAHGAFADLCHRIGRDLLGHAPLKADDRPVYLSKRALPSGVYRIVNEDEFCARLEQLGVEIISPEQLAFRQQVAIWAARTVVGAMSGSMLHTSIFVPACTYVALNSEPWINSNQAMIDAINHNRGRFLTPGKGLVRTAGSDAFQNQLQLSDPRKTANAFFKALLKAHREERVRAGRGTRQEMLLHRLRSGAGG